MKTWAQIKLKAENNNEKNSPTTSSSITKGRSLHSEASEASFQDQNNHYSEKPPLRTPSTPTHRGQSLPKPTQV